MACDLANRGANIGKQYRNSQNHGKRPIPGKLCSGPIEQPDQISAEQKALRAVVQEKM